jgi:hypothetical protein
VADALSRGGGPAVGAVVRPNTAPANRAIRMADGTPMRLSFGLNGRPTGYRPVARRPIRIARAPDPSSPCNRSAHQDGKASEPNTAVTQLHVTLAPSRPRRRLDTTGRSREEWDSNPRASCPANGFQDRRLRPLGHPPGRQTTCGNDDIFRGQRTAHLPPAAEPLPNYHSRPIPSPIATQPPGVGAADVQDRGFHSPGNHRRPARLRYLRLQNRAPYP